MMLDNFSGTESTWTSYLKVSTQPSLFSLLYRKVPKSDKVSLYKLHKVLPQMSEFYVANDLMIDWPNNAEAAHSKRADKNDY